MDVSQAVQNAQAHLKNALELAQRPVGKEELLYMWDNQITALDNFLADTEADADKLLQRAREQLRDVKKKLTDTVTKFEMEAEGEEFVDEDVPDGEWAESFVEAAGDMVGLAKEALDEKVKSIEDLIKWEEPLSVINGYLADSEPYQMASAELAKVRLMVRAAQRDISGCIKDFLGNWRQNQDADDGND
jgi:hypothetical protein